MLGFAMYCLHYTDEQALNASVVRLRIAYDYGVKSNSPPADGGVKAEDSGDVYLGPMTPERRKMVAQKWLDRVHGKTRRG